MAGLTMDDMPARLVPSPDALARELNGEVLILDLRSSHYFGLTGPGARIWQLAEAGEDTGGIVAALTREFEGDVAIIEADVVRLLGELIDRGLLIADPA